ncbi:MAG: hypothetical protein ACM3S4_02645 [Burkholderiales bacterium]
MDEAYTAKLKEISEQTGLILKRLEDIRDTLSKANESVGYLTRFIAMREEIRSIGWSCICAKYHPDVNICDPAAYELFQLYKFAYDNIERNV